MKKLIFCFAVLAFFVSCEPAVKSDHLSSIAGMVKDSTSLEPINDVYIYTNPSSNKTTYTDANGNFELQNLKVQKYSVYAKKNGYSTNHVDVTPVAGELVNIDIELKKIEQEVR